MAIACLIASTKGSINITTSLALYHLVPYNQPMHPAALQFRNQSTVSSGYMVDYFRQRSSKVWHTFQFRGFDVPKRWADRFQGDLPPTRIDSVICQSLPGHIRAISICSHNRSRKSSSYFVGSLHLSKTSYTTKSTDSVLASITFASRCQTNVAKSPS